MRGSALRRGVVTAAISLTLVLTVRTAPTFAVAGGSNATDRFLLGTRVNVGIQQNGAFGSVGNAPAGFNTRSDQGGNNTWSTAGDDMLGFTYDNGDGWGTGADIGDFFKPGGPYEGFLLTVAGSSAANDGNGTTDLGLGTWSACTGDCETWTMDSPFNGVGMVQAYSIVNEVVLQMRVTISNTTGSPIDDIYYGRCVDPDNVKAAGGGFETANNVTKTIAEDAIAVVQATASYDSVDTALLMFSDDPNARAHVNCNSNSANGNWNGIGTNLEKGDPVVNDTNIGVAVKIGTLAAGASYTFNVNYGMNLTAAAPPPPLPPTNTAWSPMSAMLAFAAALLAVAGLVIGKKERRA
jgi:hypothetical protein